MGEQTVPRAELWAVRMFIKNMIERTYNHIGEVEQVHVHTDSEIVFRGICNHHTLPRALPTGPLAEMWHEFWGDWDKLHEAGTTVYVHKVAAHAREKGIQQDQVHTHGNDAADH